MRGRNICMLGSCIISLLFSILTLIAGCKRGVLDQVAFATYSYSANFTYFNEASQEDQYHNITDPLVLALMSPTYENNLLSWFFSVHYLSLCAGYMGAQTDPNGYYHLSCSSRLGSYSFRTDDPFILNYQAIGGEYSVERGEPVEIFDLRPPFTCLVVGIVFTVLSFAVFMFETWGWGPWRDLSLVSVGVSMLAAVFLMTSSALVTRIVMRSGDDKVDYGSWSKPFLGFAWTAVGFIYCAFVSKAIDVAATKEKRRRLLRTGQN